MTYTEHNFDSTTELQRGNNIIFHVSSTLHIQYSVESTSKKIHFLSLVNPRNTSNDVNSLIFKELSIKDRFYFCNIVKGPHNMSQLFPVHSSLSDLSKTVNKLFIACRRFREGLPIESSPERDLDEIIEILEKRIEYEQSKSV